MGAERQPGPPHGLLVRQMGPHSKPEFLLHAPMLPGMAPQILGCALNFSEGSRPEIIEPIVRAACRKAALLDVSSDPDHNRTVMTLAGESSPLLDAVLDASAIGLETINLPEHVGVHPRLGAMDVIPFYPLRGTPMSKAVEAARACARRVCGELAIPCFLYDNAAEHPLGQSLPSVRRHAFYDLPPDCGPCRPHPTAGATAVGARGLLVAYNVDLVSGEVMHARSIASRLRSGPRGLPGVRALGLRIESRGTAQVSANILEPERLTLWDVYSAVQRLAGEAGVGVGASEVVGLVPAACLDRKRLTALNLRKPPGVLEEILDRHFPAGAGRAESARLAYEGDL